MSICQHCGVEFERPNRHRESKTCSKACRYALSGRSNKQAQGAQYLDRQCPQCDASFDGKTTYCSRTCSNKARSGDRHPAVRAASEARGRLCKVCGEPTQHTQRDTCPDHRRGWQKRKVATCRCGRPAANLRSKYCSTECRKKWGVRPPARMVTKVCLGCGNEFSRPHHYPGKLKYCSNRCAHKEQKATTEVAALCENGRTVIFRSGYEVRFWACCLRYDIPIRSYDGPTIKTSLGDYHPDFVVYEGEQERIIDVKGWLRPEAEQKVIEANEQGLEVHVVDKVDLEILETDKVYAYGVLHRRATLPA